MKKNTIFKYIFIFIFFFIFMTTVSAKNNTKPYYSIKDNVINKENYNKNIPKLYTNYILDESIDYENICSNSNVKSAVKIIGIVVAIIRWVAPLIIIVLGIIDFTRVILSDDEKAISKAGGALGRRIIAGIVIFFIPTIMVAILNLLEVSIDITDSNWIGCTRCILDVDNCE